MSPFSSFRISFGLAFLALTSGTVTYSVEAQVALAPPPETLSAVAPIETGQLARQVQEMRAAKQDEPLIELIERNWGTLVSAGPEQANLIGAPRDSLLSSYFEVLEHQGKGQPPQLQARSRTRLLESLQKALTEIPAVLDDRGDWMYSKLVAELIAQKRLDEALQWAKRRYVLCNYDAGALERASVMVEKVLVLQDPTYTSHQAWVASQRDPASMLANPLAEIALPNVDPQVSRSMVQLLQSRGSQKHSLISVLLVEGRNREAMEVALDILFAHRSIVDGPREVSRVLKAVDLHLHRANGFITFFKAGSDKNPLSAFVAENPLKEEGLRAIEGREGQGAAPAPALAGSRAQQVVRLTGAGAMAPPVVNESAVVLPFMTLLGPVRNGTVAPQELWEKGVLRADDVLLALRSWVPQKTRLALVGLLAKNAPERLEPAPDAHSNVRLALADYFRSTRDARAEPLFVSLLGEVKEPQKEGVLALTLLAQWYEQSGQFEKAANTYEQAEKYSTNREWIGDLFVHAARAYKRAGDAPKSSDLYARVPSYGYGWATGMALLDQAQALMARGKRAEARLLLQQPVTGKYADQIQVALSSVLAESYYPDDQPEAAKYSRQALTQYQNLDKPLEGNGLLLVVAKAKERLGWIEKWQQAPLSCSPATMQLQRVRAQGEKGEPISQRLSIHAQSNLPISVSCADKRVTIGQVDKGKASQFSYVKSVSVTVWIDPQNPEQSFDTTLLVRSPMHPGVAVRVPLHVEFSRP